MENGKWKVESGKWKMENGDEAVPSVIVEIVPELSDFIEFIF